MKGSPKLAALAAVGWLFLAPQGILVSDLSAQAECDGSPTAVKSIGITGIPRAGQTARCNDDDAWEGADKVYYQWYRDGEDIGGASAQTYVITPQDSGRLIYCSAEAGNACGYSREESGDMFVEWTQGLCEEPPTAVKSIGISGTPRVGQTLRCNDDGVWVGADAVHYLWYRDVSPIPGATAQTYIPTPEDSNVWIHCEASAVNNCGYSIEEKSGEIYIDWYNPVCEEAPTAVKSVGITGTPRVGATLRCNDDGAWEGAESVQYQWYRSGAPIGGATGQTYIVPQDDSGSWIACGAAAVNDCGVSMEQQSGELFVDSGSECVPPTALKSIGISGVAQVGETLHCDDDGAWSGVERVSYEWYRMVVTETGYSYFTIDGATAQNYTLTPVDHGGYVWCSVFAFNRCDMQAFQSAEEVGPVAKAADNAAPELSLKARSCSRKRCRIVAGVRDGLDSSGIAKFQALVTPRKRSDARIIPAEMLTDELALFNIPAPKRGRADVIITAEDAAGNAASLSLTIAAKQRRK